MVKESADDYKISTGPADMKISDFQGINEWDFVEKRKLRNMYHKTTHRLAIAIITVYCVFLFISIYAKLALKIDLPMDTHFETLAAMVVAFYFGRALNEI